jgi:hypothetical protein
VWLEQHSERGTPGVRLLTHGRAGQAERQRSSTPNRAGLFQRRQIPPAHVVIHVTDAPNTSQAIQDQPVVRPQHVRFSGAARKHVVDTQSIGAPADNSCDGGVARGVWLAAFLHHIGQRVAPQLMF